MRVRFALPLFLLLGFLAACSGGKKVLGENAWAFQPIVRLDEYNPILQTSNSNEFVDPIRREKVRWEEAHVFNPTAVVKDDRVFLLYRAQDKVGKPYGTSRIGLATSRDGLIFKKNPVPVLYPNNDPMKTFEWEGGCEDPRVVRRDDGRYIMLYTAYDGATARLCVASSADLMAWEKHGLAFSDRNYRDRWSKSGAVVCELKKGEIVAKKVKGKFWMYWGDTYHTGDLYAATSDDLITWTPLVNKKGELTSVMQPRPGFFDSKLVESGPFALLTPNGILLLYNSANDGKNGDNTLPDMAYTIGQALFDEDHPDRLLARSNRNYLRPERTYEKNGQVNNVCFLEGMVWFKDRWLLYYGAGDSRVAVAECRLK